MCKARVSQKGRKEGVQIELIGAKPAGGNETNRVGGARAQMSERRFEQARTGAQRKSCAFSWPRVNSGG